jgi:hypothetical protein
MKLSLRKTDQPKEELCKRSIKKAASKLYELTVAKGRDQRSRTRGKIDKELKTLISFTEERDLENAILKTFRHSKRC